MKTIYENNFELILKLCPSILDKPEYIKSKSPIDSIMDLNLDLLFEFENGFVIALSHLYKHPCGDLIPDPDMQIAVYPNSLMIEALAYQDSFGYKEVYDVFPNATTVNTRLKKDLNLFSNHWLRNCIEQGHILKQPKL